MKTEGTFSTDRVCEKCGDGTYQDQANRPTCKTGRVCDVGHYVSTPLTPSSNRDCGLCSAGTYSDSVNEATCKICIEGTAQPQIGQARCFECGTSAYSDTKKALSCKRIEPGFYGVGGTATMKTGVQMCSPGFACPGGSSPRLRCDGETEYSPGYGNITCSKVSLCSVGEYESHAPSQSSNRICADCPVGTFMDKRLHHAKACQPHSTCAPGTFVLTEGSSFTDTVCSRCDGITGYSSAPNQGACTPIESCRPGEFVAREPSAMQPRFCSPCPDGTYSAHSNADRCVDVQTCLPGQAVALASTASRNRICVNCIAGQSYSTFPNAPECIATTTCAPGELTSSPATKTSDRQVEPFIFCAKPCCLVHRLSPRFLQ